ncbi:peptidase S41, partial [Acidobacteria bacterium AH-259-G07]|nr:peptidase S41 [Acidobacteria bacterium AH-259-G07]
MMNSTKRESLSFAILVIFASLASLVGYSPQSVDDTKAIENLRAFAKLYGYVKYFHPSDEASRIDWDKFAVYGMEKVWQAKDKRNLNRVLEELFLPIAPTIRIYGSGEKPEAPGQLLPKERSQLKKVAWQHKGIGMGRPGPYLSVRTNRELPAGYGFGTITQFVDTGKYPGKEIKLRAYVRTNVSGTGNQGQLWLRVDTENRRLAFFDNMRDQPIKSREWKAYEIVGKVAEDAVRVVFGCFLRGAGKVWVDGFQLLIKNQNSQSEPVEIDNSGFEEGESEPNGWLTPSPGYKYRVEKEGAYEGDRCLLIENARENNLFDKAPSIGQVINKKLGAGLHCQIPLALYSDENGTIGKGSRYAFEQLAAKLAAIDLDSLTAANQFLRLGDVVIAWNIFQHFYPYFDVVGVDWDAELTVTLRKALANKTENEFYFTLKELVAKLRDGHGRVYRSVLDRKRAGLPFLADWIEGRVTITASKDPDHFQRGDIVLSIDGVEAEEALSDLERYISGSAQWKRFRSAKEFGLGSEGSIVKLEIKRGDRIFEVEVLRNQKTAIAERERPVIEELQNEIYYVDLDQAEMPQINAKMDELERAKGVIFHL